MVVKVSNEDFAKAVDEEFKQRKLGDDENLRFAVETIARDVLVASEWTKASPPAIIHVALSVINRAVWHSFDSPPL